MSSERVENLQSELLSLFEDVERRMDFVQSKTGEERKKIVRDIEKQFDSANSLLFDIEREKRYAPPPYRNQLSQNLKMYQDKLKRLKDKLVQSSSTVTRDRQDLSGAGFIDFENAEPTQRSQLLETNEVVNRTGQTLLNTQRIAADSENVGNEIITTLGQQRESLIRTKDRLTETDENLSRSKRILRTMYRRVMTNKLLLILIILIELGILIGLVYWKFFRKHK